MRGALVISLMWILSQLVLGITFGIIERNQKGSTQRQQKDIRWWHVTKAIYIGIISAGFAVLLFDISWFGLVYFVHLLALVPSIFNPTINLWKGNNFFHLSDKGPEGYFKSKTMRIVYYFFFVALSAITFKYVNQC